MSTKWYSAQQKRQRYQEAIMLLSDRKYKGKTRAQRADDIKSYGPERYARTIKQLERNLKYRQNYAKLREASYSPKDARRLASKRKDVLKETLRYKDIKEARGVKAVRDKRKMWAIWAQTRTMPSYFRDLISEINRSERLQEDDGYGFAIVYHHYVLNEDLNTSLRRYRPDVDGLEDYVIASILGR